ncbi:MAG: hypothetical protein AB1540_04195 [Bdellovibrionota bacterium]
MKTRIFKFGGSSFPRLESYNDVARYVSERLASDTERAVVVVSAMSGTTGRLLETGSLVNNNMSLETTDSLLGSGEILASALMRAAIERVEASVTHLTGYQLGIVSDSKFTRARPINYIKKNLKDALKTNKVVVVAGGQAVDGKSRLTMLGRNSSDLTAVLMASMLGLQECEIFSDVPGVYSADPYAVKEARLLREVPYDAIIEMSRAGSKVLHYGCVAHAKQSGVRIICRSAKDGQIGSIIGSGLPMPMIAVNKNIVIVRFTSESALSMAESILRSEGIVAVRITDQSGVFRLSIWTDNRAWQEVSNALNLELEESKEGALVTTLDGSGHLNQELVPKDQVEDYVKRLHASFYGHVSPCGTPHAIQKDRAEFSGVLVGVAPEERPIAG